MRFFRATVGMGTRTAVILYFGLRVNELNQKF